MKITQLRDKDKTTALTTMDMETWIGKTRTETKTRPVSAFREVLRYSLPDSRCY
ncbi:helicase, partial [Phocaeicola vulgatus]